jgi:biotin synthase
MEGLEELYDAGSRAMLMRFETSNPELYAKLHPGRALDTRLAHIRRAYELGYIIMTGSLIGIPGQTVADILDDIKLAKKLRPEMYSFGPFLPHPGTPLAACPPGQSTDVLKVMALARLVDAANAKIAVTTALETVDPSGMRQGLLSGGNTVMLNVTPLKYRRHYEIYPNKAHSGDSISSQIETTVSLLKSLGRAPTDLGIRENAEDH